MDNMATNTAGISIRNFLLIEIQNVNFSSMFIRPYMFNNITDKNIHAVEEGIISNMGGNNSMSLAGCLNSFGSLFGISNKPTNMMVLPNGNDMRRFRFILDLEKTSQYGSTLRYIIQGYTNHSDIAMTGGTNIHLDPNMILYINSITEYYTTRRSDGAFETKLLDSYNTISGMNLVNMQQGRDLVATRAKDLHQMILFKEENERVSGFSGTVDVSSVGAICNTDVIATTRSNLDPITYLTKLLNTYQEGVMLGSITGVDDQYRARYQVLQNATIKAAEPIFGRNAVVQFLSSMSGSNYNSNAMTFALFGMAFPDIMKVVKVITRNDASMLESSIQSRRAASGFITDVENTLNTAQTDVITSKVLEFNNSIVGYLTDVGITEAVIMIGYNGDPNMSITEIVSAKSLLGDAYVIPGCNKVSNLLKLITLPKFLMGIGNTTVNIRLDVNLISDTLINVSIPEYNYFEVFRLPSFCDSMYLPTISTREDRNILCNDLEQVHHYIDRCTNNYNMVV